MEYQAIIFDMDGLLLDSERLGQQSYMAACEQMGVAVNIPLYLKCIGTNAVRTRELMLEGYGNASLVDELRDIWVEEYAARAFSRPVPLKPGVESILGWLDATKLPLAVATSTAHDHAQQKLTNAGIRDYFRFVVGGDQVNRGKPDPEIYLKAASRLGTDPGTCLALEDSTNGVLAAHAAGMTVIQVPDLVPPDDELKALNHPIFSSLEDVEVYLRGMITPG